MDVAVPVTVVTGFLGAGKTTLLNRWLSTYPRGTVAVVVNEHGEAGIDGELLAERVRTLVEITGGCVCCATQHELVRALDTLAAHEPPFARIFVETSGAASPAGVVRAIARAKPEAIALDGVIAVVDASRLGVLDAHELAVEQVGYADVVVLSRADACGEAALANAEARLAALNEVAVVARAARGDVATESSATASLASPSTPSSSTSSTSLEGLLAQRTADFSPRTVPVASAHVYESIALRIDGEVSGDRFADFMETELATFAGRLLRTKGILAVEGMAERMIVQGVADLVEVTFGAPWADAARSSRLVVVGFGLDRDALTNAFARCAAREP